MAELEEAAVKRHKARLAERWRSHGLIRPCAVWLAKIRRVPGQDALDLRVEEFLVLLLVLDADPDHELQVSEAVFVDCLDQSFDTPVHGLAIAIDFFDCGSADGPTARPREPWAQRGIVGIQHIIVCGVFRCDLAAQRGQRIPCEEPTRVSEVPPGWTDIFNRLSAIVLRMERTAHLDACPPHPTEVLQ